MLALQPPRMGSSKPPDLELPLGRKSLYHVLDTEDWTKHNHLVIYDGPTSNFPVPSPPIPEPGSSLLDDSESKFFEGFFDSSNLEQINNNDFLSNSIYGQNSLFGWSADLPPAFLGTATSFGLEPPQNMNQIDAPNMGYDGGSSQMHMPSSAPPVTTSPDVLAAASLLQNGHLDRSHSHSNNGLFAPMDLSLPLSSHQHIQQRPPSIPNYQTAQPRAPALKEEQDEYGRQAFYTNMVFSHDAHAPIKEMPQKNDLVRWGSDSGFRSGQNFVAPPNQETVEDVERKLTQRLSFAQPLRSASTTGPPSPVATRNVEPPQHELVGTLELENDEDEAIEPELRPKKKTRMKKEGVQDVEPATTKKTPRKRKQKSVPMEPNPEQSPQQASPRPSTKRRKSSVAVASKLPRENLTEDQKRENHIRSEQKRRTLIKEGFDDLNELVPDLKGGGFSKSAVLVMTADWLEDLIKGNAELKERLHKLEAGR